MFVNPVSASGNRVLVLRFMIMCSSLNVSRRAASLTGALSAGPVISQGQQGWHVCPVAQRTALDGSVFRAGGIVYPSIPHCDTARKVESRELHVDNDRKICAQINVGVKNPLPMLSRQWESRVQESDGPL